MAKNALYDIYAAKCFALAHTMVIHSDLIAQTHNTNLERKGFKINHNNPKTWKYYLNLAGEYHESDKNLIATLNGDDHPYMRIKIAGDNKPVIVDFTKDLVSGNTGDYSLAAEYSYGSDYYNELVRRYPGCESLILGILNPIDIDLAIGSGDGDILYCGGYYRKRLAGLKELYGFERREDVKIDTDFLIEEWEEGLIFDLQDWIKDFLKAWVIKDFQEYHTYYSEVMLTILLGSLVGQIHKLRLINNFTYSAHSYHVREFINSFGYLGEYVDVLTREQQQYLYRNMKWLTTNKGKEKVLTALIDNLLTPSGIPLVAYHMGHDNWDMEANGALVPTIEFKKEYLNLDPLTNDIGTDIATMIKKEEFEARDNGKYVDEQVRDVASASEVSKFNSLQTKILESDFTQWDSSVFYNKEEFQFYQWVFAVSRGTYRGSIFVTHPVTGGRLQLTPLTALNLLFYAFAKGYYNYELENSPPMVIRQVPKNKNIQVVGHEPYPDKAELLRHTTSGKITDDMLNKQLGFPQPDHNFTSTTDFFNKTEIMFDTMELRRAYAAAEEDIFANGELENIVAKFYHPFIELKPIVDIPYNTWLNNIGVDVSKLDRESMKVLADDLLLAGLGTTDRVEKSTERMHASLINIVKYFLSYTVQLVSRFTKTTSRVYGLKTLRKSIANINRLGISEWDIGMLTFIKGEGFSTYSWWYKLFDLVIGTSETHSTIESYFPLIDLISTRETYREQGTLINMVGLYWMHPRDDNPDEPYSDFKSYTYSSIKSETLPDVIDVTGQRLHLTLEPGKVGFLDTYGLTELNPDDFNFVISLED